MMRSLVGLLWRQLPAVVLASIVLAAAGDAAANVVVNPGESVNLLPEDCADDAGYQGGLGNSWDACLEGCLATCNLTAGTADALFNLTTTVGSKFVTSTIFSQFDIADSAGSGASVGATLDYDIA